MRTFEDDPIGVKEVVLDNGLTLLLSENHEQPRFYGAVVVKAGGKNDPPEATGIAHYLEHMLFKGTTELGTTDYEKERVHLDKIEALYDRLAAAKDDATRGKIDAEIQAESKKAERFAIPNEYDRLVRRLGCTGTNAGTSQDWTMYMGSCPANQIGRWLSLTAHRFERPVFRLFQPELETVFEEKNRSQDNFLSMLIETYLDRLYPDHPYGRQTVLGEVEHIKRPSLSKMRAFYETHYVANNMALVLVGDFDADEVIPRVRAAFGGWPRRDVPRFEAPEPKPFDGHEVIRVFMSPLRAGAVGFRTVDANHPDKVVFSYIQSMLNNKSGAGLLDQINRDKRVLFTYHLPMIQQEAGASIIAYVPIPLIEPFFMAEWFIMSEINTIKRGEFDDALMETIRRNIALDRQAKWETNRGRAREMVTSFARGFSWADTLEEHRRTDAVTREDVIRVAERYYGDDSLHLNSYWGLPSKERIPKPGYPPVEPARGQRSAYYDQILQLPADTLAPRFVDLDGEVIQVPVQGGVTLLAVRNPFNEIFELELAFGIGRHEHRALEGLASYLGRVGSSERDAEEMAQARYALAVTTRFRADDDRFVVTLRGPEESLAPALTLLDEVLRAPELDESQIDKVSTDIAMLRKGMRGLPAAINPALQEYALYGKRSTYLWSPGPGQIKKLTAAALLKTWRQVQRYSVTAHYTGRQAPARVADLLRRKIHFTDEPLPARPKVVRARRSHSETTIYFVPKEGAVQSYVSFVVEGDAVDHAARPAANAFGEYFGGSMSGLVFREIRELRSLAYAAGGSFDVAPLPGHPAALWAYLGCQADKTEEGIAAMLRLIQEMPEEPDRVESLRAALIERAGSERPGFRALLPQVEAWRDLGYASDPRRAWLEAYPEISFKDIVAFYRAHVAGRPVVLSVVANPDEVDVEQLARFGTVIEVEEDALFSK